MMTPCGHYFHMRCIAAHANSGGTKCPLCRALLVEDAEVDDVDDQGSGRWPADWQIYDYESPENDDDDEGMQPMRYCQHGGLGPPFDEFVLCRGDAYRPCLYLYCFDCAKACSDCGRACCDSCRRECNYCEGSEGPRYVCNDCLLQCPKCGEVVCQACRLACSMMNDDGDAHTALNAQST